MTAAEEYMPAPRLWPDSKIARRLGMCTAEFIENRASLEAYGFPRRDILLGGNTDSKAVDIWVGAGKFRQWKTARRIAARIAAWKAENPDPPDWAVALVREAHRRAKKRGLTCTITPQDIMRRVEASEGRCELSGLPFVHDKSEGHWRRPFAPSLDRIDSARGYDPDNVRVVLCAVNAAINEWGFEQFLALARAIVRKHGERP